MIAQFCQFGGKDKTNFSDCMYENDKTDIHREAIIRNGNSQIIYMALPTKGPS